MRALRSVVLFALAAALAALTVAAPLQAQAGQVVGPGGFSQLGNPNNWITDQRMGAFAEVTDRFPCGLAASGPCSNGFGSVGSGSLELRVSGVNTGTPTAPAYPDWAFWYRYADGSLANTIANSASFGSLNNLTAMSFDWYRVALPGWDAPPASVSNGAQPIPPVDWRYKTPVFRLRLQEQRTGKPDVFSELIWEGYYNAADIAALGAPNGYTPVDQWVRQQGMQGGNFWYTQVDANGNATNYGVGGACDGSFTFWQGGIDAGTTNNLFSAGGCLNGTTDVRVVGVGVGVGSAWPLPWEGAVDNVRLGFGPTQTLTLDANFDATTVVPEPSTYALMGTGLLAVGMMARRRRREQGAAPATPATEG